MVGGDDAVHQVKHARAVGEAEHVADLFGSDLLAAAVAGALHDRLVENGKAVAGGAFGGARDQSKRFGRDIGAFLRADVGEVVGQGFGREALQVETLAARQDGDGDLADLGRREDEFHMRRRFFQRLQQRVERRRREHVHFVDDVDLVPRIHGRIARAAQQVAHVVDAGVRGGVEFEHVGVTPLHDGGAVHAGRIEQHRRLVDGVGLVVQRTGEQAGRRRLADAANAGEHEGVRDASGPERVGERADHRLLADKVLEPGRPVFAGEDLIGHGAERDVIAEHGRGHRVTGRRNIVHRPVFGRPFSGRLGRLFRRHGRYMAHKKRNRQPSGANLPNLLWNATA